MCGKVTEKILDIFFENFSQVEGAELRAKYKRRGLVRYFSALIQGCRQAKDCDPQRTCRDAIVAILRYHKKCINSNGGVCKRDKTHDVLYVAIKLCYEWKLNDNPTVVAVLDQIYLCEKTFENIWLGAVIREPFYSIRWNNDYEGQEDNFRAAFYLLEHATNAKLEYSNENGERIRYIDVPFKTSSVNTPLIIFIIYGLSDKAHTFLRFGAAFDNFIVHILYNRLVYNQPSYPNNLAACLRLILRTSNNKEFIHFRNVNPESFYKLIKKCLIPLQRCGVEPPELKHLCRCTIRKRLRQNYQLPNGIKKLEIPKTLHDYLDLLRD